MSALGPLFDAPPSVRVDTSEAAAASIATDATKIRDRVEDFIRRCGMFGATEQEVEDGLALSGNTARPRLWELEKEGRVMKSTRTRQTRSGRKARVYVCS